MDTQTLVTIISSAGGSALLLTLIKGVGSWINGSAGRERTKNTDLESQRAAAVLERDASNRRADAEATKARKTAEYASILRRQLTEAGMKPHPWPADLINDPTVTTNPA